MKITMYRTLCNRSQRNVKKYLESYELEYVEQNIINEPLSWDQFKEMLINSEDGLEGLLSTRSKAYTIFKRDGIDIESMSIKEAHELIVKYPTLLKSPITVGKSVTLVGYTDEIDVFVPRDVRKENMQRMLLNEDNFIIDDAQWAV